MYRFFLMSLLGLLGIISQVQAHGGGHTSVHTNVSVHVGGGGYHGYGYGYGRGYGYRGWAHDRVYYTDPWYHPNHVYIYGGDPYAVYYYGQPYYYFDPRFYYFP